MEIKTKVNTYIVNHQCDKCKEGSFIFQNKMKKAIDNKSLLFMHRCSKCGAIQNIKNKQYPQISYEKIIENE